ncbi:MAG: ComEC/Rec2 family competence protein [Flavobacteriales bacterium]
MVKIIFKDVGQGDSIIIEWVEEEINCFGFIDCNLYESRNPILDYVIEKNIKLIDFLILSHPHLDHFSGFHELLTYCRENNIIVKKFLHTAIVSKEYFLTSVRSVVAENELMKLFDLVRILRDETGMGIHSLDDNPDIVKKLGQNFKLEVLAPSSVEIDKYIKGINFPFDEEESTCHPKANWLSTIIKIYNDKCAVLLTSDSESSTLSTICTKKPKRVDHKFIIGQAPHHGSGANLNQVFWRLRKRFKNTPIVISVGKNGYKHPSKKVIDFFEKTGNYEIYSTNHVGSLISKPKSSPAMDALDIISKVTTVSPTKYKYSGDKVFILTEDILKIV